VASPYFSVVTSTNLFLRAETRFEAATMALYVSFVLLVALAAVGDHSTTEEHAIIWGSTLGLALAHGFAFTIADRLVDDESDEGDHTEVLLAQMLAAAAIACEATATVVVLPEKWELDGARLVTAVSIGVIVYVLARKGGRSPVRSAAAAALAFVFGVAVAAVKLALTH
jgi:hypothetical protein